MSNTAEALVALHAAEAELEAALAAEHEADSGTVPAVAQVPADPPPGNDGTVTAPPAAESVTAEGEVGVSVKPATLGPEQIAFAKEVLSRGDYPAQSRLLMNGPTLEEYVSAGYLAENYPPAGYAVRVAKLKWLVLPGYLGPIAINGS